MANKRELPLEFTGVQYPGRRSVTEIFAEIERQSRNYRDYLVSTRKMTLLQANLGIVLHFAVDNEARALPLSDGTWKQLMQWLGLPITSNLFKRLRFGYDYNRRRSGDFSNRFWPTLCNLVNDHFSILGVRKLVRTLMTPGGDWYVRALLSNRYKIIPNGQLFMAVAEKIKDSNAEIWDARLSENRLYLYCVAPGISAQIRTDRTFENRWIGDAGDVVNAAISISNSETGHGGCEVCPAIVTGVTGSYFVRQNALSMRHVGERHEMDAMLSERTIMKENQIVFDKIKDIVEATFDPEAFQTFVDRMNDATQDELEDPIAAANALQVIYEISDERRDAVANWLIKSGDRSRYGLATAVANEAHDNSSLDAEEAVRLETCAADLIERQTMLKLAKVYKETETRRAMKEVAKIGKEIGRGIEALT